MSEPFYIALFGTIGAAIAMVPAAILAYATLVKVRKIGDDQNDLKREMNGHMSRVLEITAARGQAEGELKGRTEKALEYLTAKTRAEERADAQSYQEQANTTGPDWKDTRVAGKQHVATAEETVANAQKTARDAQAVAKGAQTVAKNLTEENK